MAATLQLNEAATKVAQALNQIYPHIVPVYVKPSWWELRRKLYIKWMDKKGLAYKLVDRNGILITVKRGKE